MHIARCKLNLGCAEEALHVMSNDLVDKASSLLSIACTLADIHDACDHPDLARAVLRWAAETIEGLGPENPYLAYMLCTMYLKVFALEHEADHTDAAKEALRQAIEAARIADRTGADVRSFAFLSPTKDPELMTNQPSCIEMIRMLLDHVDNNAYQQLLDE